MELPDYLSGRVNSTLQNALLDKSHYWILRNPINTLCFLPNILFHSMHAYG